MSTITVPETYAEDLAKVLDRVIDPAAAEIDREGAFPRQAIEELGRAGLLGLVSATKNGGRGEGLAAASEVIRELAGHCGSTAMVVLMHYAATLVVEAHGSESARRSLASGRLSTLAFSEAGSRSHFWSPVSTASRVGTEIRLDANKSWVTSAGEADYYVWSSLPLEAEGASTLWLVPGDAAGLRVAAPFDGLGLRGNASSPIVAEAVSVSPEAMLGPDGGGFDVMMSVVLPSFQIMSASFSVGLMEAAVNKAVAHVSSTRLAHLGQSLADLPTIRAYLARARILTDMTWTLVQDALRAVEESREDAMLRILESKAAAGEAAAKVTNLAMRVCGGAAYRKDVGIERHFRDSQAATVMAPTTDVLYDFIGKAICGLPLF